MTATQILGLISLLLLTVAAACAYRGWLATAPESKRQHDQVVTFAAMFASSSLLPLPVTPLHWAIRVAGLMLWWYCAVAAWRRMEAARRTEQQTERDAAGMLKRDMDRLVASPAVLTLDGKIIASAARRHGPR